MSEDVVSGLDAQRSAEGEPTESSSAGNAPESPHNAQRSSGYWYGRTGQAVSSVDLLNLLRQYREEEKQMRIRTRESMRMGETDLVALRYLLHQRSLGKTPRQRDLAQTLHLTPPSVSVLVDRLSRDGYIRRVPHPEDRRSVGIEVLAETDREVKATLSSMHAGMLDATESLTEEERVASAKFLRGLIDSVRSATFDGDSTTSR